MKKIITEEAKIKAEKERLSKLVVCNTPKMSDHCKNQCLHGRPHTPDRDREGGCSKEEFCSLSNVGIRKVKCRKLKASEIKEIMNEGEQK